MDIDDAATPRSVRRDELLLRRVLPKWHQERQGRSIVPPTWTDFKPGHNDCDGLSLTRRRFVRELEALAHTEYSGQPRTLAQIRFEDIEHLKMSVVAKPISDNPGHAVVPEMNRTDYERKGPSRDRIKEAALKLAACAEVVYDAPQKLK